jgi:hypothetical protein
MQTDPRSLLLLNLDAKVHSLTSNQKHFIALLMARNHTIGKGLLTTLLLKLGFLQVPSPKSPISIAVYEVGGKYLVGNASGRSKEYDRHVPLIRALGQLGDLKVAIEFIFELAMAIEDCIKQNARISLDHPKTRKI